MACLTRVIAVVMADESGRRYAREKAGIQQRRGETAERGTRNSALKGHVDYVDLAERVAQGVTVDATGQPDPQRPSRNRSIPETGK